MLAVRQGDHYRIDRIVSTALGVAADARQQDLRW